MASARCQVGQRSTKLHMPPLGGACLGLYEAAEVGEGPRFGAGPFLACSKSE